MRRGQPSALHNVIRDLSATAPASWLLSRTLHRVDKLAFRLTEGRHTLSNIMTGLPIVMLSTTGAKSGRNRTVPVLGLPDGGSDSSVRLRLRTKRPIPGLVP